MLFALFDLSPTTMLILGVLAILLFGERLPEVARSVGKAFMEFKKQMSGFETEIRRAVDSATTSITAPMNEVSSAMTYQETVSPSVDSTTDSTAESATALPQNESAQGEATTGEATATSSTPYASAPAEASTAHSSLAEIPEAIGNTNAVTPEAELQPAQSQPVEQALAEAQPAATLPASAPISGTNLHGC